MRGVTNPRSPGGVAMRSKMTQAGLNPTATSSAGEARITTALEIDKWPVV